MRVVIDVRLRSTVMTGAGRYLAGLVPALAAISPEDEFVLLVKGESLKLWEDLPDNVRLQEVAIDPAGFRQHMAIASVLKQIAPDLLHYPMFDLPLRLGVPSVITINDLNPISFPNYFTRGRWWRRAAANFLHHYAISRALRILTPSRAVADDICRVFPGAKEKIVAVHYAYSGIPNKKENISLEELKKRFKLPENYLLYVGVHRPHKNVEGLIHAIALLKGVGVDVALVGAGSFDDRFGGPMSAVTKLGLEKEINFIGYTSDEELAVLYRGAIAFVFPSFQEGFGMPLLEAMDLEVPVACSNIPVHREVAGKAAVFFNPYSHDDIAQVIRRLITEDQLRQSLIRQGKERVKTFRWEDCARETLNVYREAVSIGRGV